MKQTYDIESILFGLLKNSIDLTSSLSGGIYVGQRPLNSKKEDIVINTIALSQEFAPQIGTSNVNIHVLDIDAKLDGIAQKVENRKRLSEISAVVLSVLRSSKIIGLKISIENQVTIAEPDINQHFVNLRLTWSIH